MSETYEEPTKDWKLLALDLGLKNEQLQRENDALLTERKEIEAAAIEKFKQHIINQMGENLSGDEGCDLIVPIYEFELFKSQLRQQGGE